MPVAVKSRAPFVVYARSCRGADAVLAAEPGCYRPAVAVASKPPEGDVRQRLHRRSGMAGQRAAQPQRTLDARPDHGRLVAARTDLTVNSRPAAVTAIKAFHTLAWLSIESCVVYVLYTGMVGRTDRRAGIAAAVVAGETLVFAGNGFRCPLTELATRYGAEAGSVTDIYLPKWFAHSIPAIHAPLLVLMAYLHVRNYRRGRRVRPLGRRGAAATRARAAPARASAAASRVGQR